MIKKMKASIATVLSVISFNGLAAESGITHFSNCDASFFTAAANNPLLRTIPERLYSSNLKKDKKVKLDLHYTTPEGIEVSGFVVTYTDFDAYKEYTPMDVRGQFYYWGFTSTQPIETVVALMSKTLSLQKLDDENYVFNPMIKNEGSNWVKNNSAVTGISPAEKTTEKVFLIEKADNQTVEILCSLQGSVSQQDLYEAGVQK